jgi:pilus assembly protein CpaE
VRVWDNLNTQEAGCILANLNDRIVAMKPVSMAGSGSEFPVGKRDRRIGKIMAERFLFITLDIKNPKLEKDFQRIIGSVEGYGVRGVHDSGATDILILETCGECSLEKDFGRIASLLAAGTVRAVFLTGGWNEPKLLLQARQLGVREFFSQPIQARDVRQALLAFREEGNPLQRRTTEPGRIVNVIGSKGGIGTTTIAVNLATSLSVKSPGHSVALVEMNRIFGEMTLFLGVEPTCHWGEIARSIDRLDSPSLRNALPKHASGVHLLLSPASLMEKSVVTAGLVGQVLSLMQGAFDFVILDSGPSFDSLFPTTLKMSGMVFLVAVLTLPCLANVSKILNYCETLGYPGNDQIKIIVNRYFKNSEISLEEAEAAIKRKIHFTLPNDYKSAMSSISQGAPLLEVVGRVPLTRSIQQISDELVLAEQDGLHKRMGGPGRCEPGRNTEGLGRAAHVTGPG